MAGAKRHPRRWLRVAAWTGGVLAALLAAAIGVAWFMLSGQTGRTLVENAADGREAGGYGVVELSDLSGNPLDRLTIGEITLTDSEGVWLTLENVTVDWSPLALIGRRLALEEVTADRVSVARRPVRAETDSEGGGPGLSVSLERLAVARLELDEPVIGVAAALRLDGGFARVDGDWRADAVVERLDAPGDRLAFEARLGEQIVVDGALEAAPGGALATLMRAPEAGLSGRFSARGTDRDGAGELVLEAGDAEALSATLGWADARAVIEGEARPGAWPGLERIAGGLGGPAEFRASAPLRGGVLRRIRLEAVETEIDSPGLQLSLQRTGPRTIALEASQLAGLVAALSRERVVAGTIAADGVLHLDDAPRFEGSVRADGLDLGFASFGRVSGPVTLEGPLAAPTIETRLETTGASVRWASVDGALGDAPAVEAAFAWNRTESRLDFESLRVAGAAGTATGSGMVELAGREYAFVASSPDFDFSRIREAVGARGPVEAEVEGDFSGAVEFDVDVASAELAEAWNAYVADGASARIAGRFARGEGLQLRTLSVDSDALTVDAHGERSGGVWSLAGEAVWSGDAPVAAMRLEGAAAAAFEFRSSEQGVRVRAEIAADEAGAGPVRLAEPRLRLEGGGPLDAFTGAFRLEGDAETGRVDLAGDFARRGDGVALEQLEGRYGGFSVEGRAAAGPGALDARLTLVPLNGFGSFDVRAELAGGVLDARVRGRDMVRADMVYLDTLTATAQGPLEQVALGLELDGAYGASLRLEGEGEARLAGGPFDLSMSLAGTYGRVDVATIEPMRLQGGEGFSGALALAVGDGELRAGLEQVQGELGVELTARDAPAALISMRRGRAPTQGTLSADLALDRDGAGVWTGTAEIAGRDLAPAELPDAAAVDGVVRATLDREALVIDAAATGAELDARAEARAETGPVRGADDLLADGVALSGSGRIAGEIATLAAFHIGEGRRLAGDVEGGFTLAGTVGAPDITGDLSLNDGRFRDALSGLSLEALSAQARFEQDRLVLSELSATDGADGRFTGSGRLDLAGGAVSASADLAFDSFRLVERDEASVTGTGEAAIAFSDNRVSVSGETRIDRAEIRPPEARREPIPRIEVREINLPGQPNGRATRRGGPVVAFDYDVVAPARVFVRGSSFDTEWSLDVHVGGTLDALDLEGTATLQRGRASLLGRPFTLARGRVVFNGPPEAATFDVEAVREAREITARILVSGTAQAPQIRLTSSPALPEDEVASRLLFDQGAGSLSGVQAAQLAGALASLTGAGFDPIAAARAATGLDQLSVTTGRTGETVVSGGRYLTEDVYLELETGGESAAPTTRIEWSLTNRLTLLSRLSGQGEADVAVSWRMEYD